MSPTDDTFMSGSLDNSVRLWDLRTPNCSGIMQVQGKPVSCSRFMIMQYNCRLVFRIGLMEIVYIEYKLS